MRWTLLLLALLLAGCASNNANSIPDGGAGHTTPTTTTSTPTSPTSTTPTDTPPSGGTTGGPPSGGMLVRPAHNESSLHDFTITGDESASGFIGGEGEVTFAFTATNDGTAATGQGGCVQDPTIDIVDANGTRLALQPPTAQCMGIVNVDIPPGGSMSANLTWNGTAYRGDTAYVVPPGQYTVEGSFHGERDGAPFVVGTSIPVNVLDASDRGAL